MPSFTLSKKILVLSIFFVLMLIFGITVWIFYNRPPVLIVTDASFSQLYGPERLERQMRRVSFSLFRRVIPVLIDEGAGPELMAMAAEEAYAEPWAVLFPYRYLEGALRYRGTMPETQILVIGGSSQESAEAFSLVSTDTRTDLYRAGMAAALLTGEKQPLLFSDGALSDELREVFQQGLTDSGCFAEPVFLNASSSYSSFSEIGCVVAAGPATGFTEQNLDIPMILFSWLDPDLTPGTVKIIFDDSPLTLAVEGLKALPSAKILLPSSTSIFRDRLEEKGVYTKLKGIMRKK